MSTRALALLLVLFCCASPAQQPAPQFPEDALISSAHVWEVRGRGDLARGALEKLATSRASSPRVLLELGELHLRMQEIERARGVLTTLEARWPDAPETRAMQTGFRLSTSQKVELASIQRLVDLGRGAEARAALEQLLPEAPTDGMFALEYYRIIGSAPDGGDVAIAGLRTLVEKHPGDSRYTLALERQLARQEAAARPSPPSMVKPDRKSAQTGSSSMPEHPHLPDLAAIEANTQEANLQAMHHALHLTRTTEAAGHELVALADSLSEADAPEDDASAEVLAARWLGRAEISRRGRQLDLAATQLRVASAFRTRRCEDTIALIDFLASAGREADIGPMLRSGTRLCPDSAWLFETHVRWLMDHGQAADALAQLRSRPIDATWTAARQASLEADALDARAQQLLAVGDKTSAAAVLTDAVQRAPARPWPRYRLAGLSSAAQGRALMDEGLALAPADDDMRFARALYLSSIGNDEEAFEAVSAISPETRTDAMHHLHARLRKILAEKPIREAIRADRFEDARREVQALLTQYPEDVSARVLRADIERAAGNVVGARDLYAALAAEYPEDAEIRLSYADLEDGIQLRQRAWVESAFETRTKPGDEGISQYDANLLPTTWSFARGYDQRIFLHADAMTLSAGDLPQSYDRAALVGTVQARGPAAERPFANKEVRGVALGAAWEGERFAVDVGTTPLGFPVTNVLGGAFWTPRIGVMGLAVGAERRAVDGGVLSLAGFKDPISGETWGGVVRTGPSLSISHYDATSGFSAAVERSVLTGRNVRSNDYFGARVGADWKFISRPALAAFAGFRVQHWQYARNLQHYTFGSGGYYSPQAYTSVALPLEVQGYAGDWSYRLRATVAHSWSRQDSIDFYPNDPDLQTAAVASPLPSGYAAPVFEGGSGGSLSVSGYAAVERIVSVGLVLGMKLDLDRSDYYRPTILMLYARHAFGEPRTAPETPPRPVRPFIQ